MIVPNILTSESIANLYMLNKLNYTLISIKVFNFIELFPFKMRWQINCYF